MSNVKRRKITDFFQPQRQKPTTRDPDSERGASVSLDVESGVKGNHARETDPTRVKASEEDDRESGIQENGDGREDGKDGENKDGDDVEVKPTNDASKHVSATTTFGSFDKEAWVELLSSEQRELLKLEIEHLHVSWLSVLHPELTKPYFLELKRFLRAQASKTVFPPPHMIYLWSHLTPLPEVKCLILGQDPYHNYNQAHGLAFSVLDPTRPPPSLVNIFKTLVKDYPNFETPTLGNLSKWARRGILMLNACLTVEAHKANSHANHGWETFTEQVIRAAINHHQNTGFVVMAWGSPAQKRVAKFQRQLANFLVLRTVHPSPLSAHRGFFDSQVFKKCNEWLQAQKLRRIDWGLREGNVVV